MEIWLEDDRVARLMESGLLFVGIGRTREANGMSWVDLDYETLIARCVHHLADLGHRDIALVNRSAELVAAGYGPGHRARAGFDRATDERGLRGVVACCADDAQAGQACTEQLLAGHPELTAIATVNEAAVPGVYHALARMGRTVPRDFSIVGVVARHWAENLHPPLTAADVPAV